MIVKDVMHNFELFQPRQLKDAFALLDRYGKDSWKIAGGNDSLTWFKDRAKRPKAVIDISGIAELKGIRETADGIEIGALATLAEIAKNPVIRGKYRVLADAAVKVASPQIRNTGTIGGNAAQDSRCWYYRYGLPCYRAGGNTCYADTPEGVNREHAIFDTDRCVTVSPSGNSLRPDRRRAEARRLCDPHRQGAHRARGQSRHADRMVPRHDLCDQGCRRIGERGN